MRKDFGTNILQKVWIFPEVDIAQYECSWEKYTPKSNCKYLQGLVAALEKHGFSVGIVANKRTWKQIFGATDECPEASKNQLWWLPDAEEQSGLPDFANYQKIADWQVPYMKRLNVTSVCGETAI